MTAPALSPGQILAGKYRLDRVLGQGAMGLVVSATHLVLGTPVAIKVMLGGGKKTEEHTVRFLREAQVAALLRSQHAAKVLDVGTLDDGAPYIVMEYLQGKDLQALLQDRGVLSLTEAVGYTLQACEALAEAHAHGIVHRDIKPANLFLTTGIDGKPCVKVVDFGVAKVKDSTATGTAAALGSPLFMSPEQVRGSREVDGRSDVWSLGVTLYLMLAGTPPFYHVEIMPLVTRIFLEPPTPIEQFRRDLPPAFVAVLMQCFEKDRERRWPSVAAFAAALAPFADADHAAYTTRIAAVQNVEVAPSRPTTEIPMPSPQAIEAAAQRRTVPMPPVAAAPREVGASPVVAPQPAARSYRVPIAVAAVLVAIAAPIAVFTGLRARGNERVETQTTASTSTVTGTPPVGAANAEPATSATSEGTAIAAPAASLIPTGKPAAARPVGTVARPVSTAVPRDGVLGGARR